MSYALERAVAIDAARRAGRVLHQYFETALTVDVKDDATFVTQADKKAEDAVRAVIEAAFPTHSIVGEEGGEQKKDSEYQWIIDPLDGTANFINGIPIFAVSIALKRGNDIVVGVVYNPETHALFAATQGGGTEWNDAPVRVSDQTANRGMISFGQSSHAHDRLFMQTLFVNAPQHVKRVRHLGSAALELSFLARGGTEGYINVGTKPWDFSAGLLIAREAGAMITNFDGEPCGDDERYFIASNGIIHDDLLALVRTSRAQVEGQKIKEIAV